MADANYDASLKIGLEADLSGGVQTEKQLDQLKRKAREFGKDGENSVGTLSGAFGKLRGAIGLVKNVLVGFGVGAVIAGIVSQVSKIAYSFKSAKKAADDLAKVQQQLAADKSIQALAIVYERMKDAAASAARELQHAVETGNIALQNASRLDAAERNRSKEIELSNLDVSAPDYNERKAAIEARYASLDADAASYDEEMRTLQERAAIAGQVGVKENEAAAQDAKSKWIKAKINAAKVKKGKAYIDAQALNEYDKTDGISIVGKTLSQFGSPSEWGRILGVKTPEGDKVRQAAAEKAAAAELEIGDLEEQLRESREEAASRRREAKQLREKQKTFDDRLKAIRIERETSKSSSSRQQKTADLALVKKKKDMVAADLQHNIDRNLIASAPEEEARMQAEADAAQARLNEADAARSARLVDVQHRRTLGRVSDGAASREVAAAESEFKQVEAEVGAVLTRLREEMKSFQAELRKAESREQSYKEGA